jgi:glycerol-3-phosphate dehydrogenase (NAD(P)+)
MQQILPYLSPQQILINASKGIENKTLLTMSEVVREVLLLKDGQRLAVLSGPSFAREVCKAVPTAVTIASENLDLAQQLQQIFSTPYFRVYTNPDVTGVELGGALKNVIAIAAGISDGLSFGSRSSNTLRPLRAGGSCANLHRRTESQ